jgi:hypothetical protein
VGNTTSGTRSRHWLHVPALIAALAGSACSQSDSKDGSGPISRAMERTSLAMEQIGSDVATRFGLTGSIAPGSDAGKPGTGTAKPSTVAQPEKPAASRRSAARGPVVPVEKVPAEPEPVPIVASVEPRVAAARAPEPDPPAATLDDALVVNRPTYADTLLPIYSEDDTEVVPAKLLTTQTSGPLFSGIRPDMNTMELVISPSGRVETVRLMSPTKRMTDMLLLSGAKTWKFSPAIREGQAVRYRTMFSWEITP